MDQALRIAARRFAEDPTSENAMVLASKYIKSAENLAPEYDIDSVLTVATSHLSAWEYETVANIWETASTEYGLWLHVLSVESTITPNMKYARYSRSNFPNLFNLLNLAKSLQCEWLLLDSGGPIIPQLEVFDLDADVEVPQE